MSEPLNPYEQFDEPGGSANPYAQFDDEPAAPQPRRRGPTRATRQVAPQYQDQGQQVRAPRRAPTLIGQVSDFFTGENRREQGATEFTQQAPVTRLRDGRVPNAVETMQALATDPDYRRRWLEDEGRNWATAFGFFLDRNERSRAEIIQQQWPRAEFRRDEYGNLQARMTPEHQWGYINRPGLSVQDGADFGADVALLAPAARGARAVGMAGAPVRTVAGRAGTAAVLGGVTEAARQGAATTVGGRGPQAGDVARTAVAMGVAQPFDDAISAAGQAVDDLARTVPGRPNQNWTGGPQAAQQARRDLGAAQTAAAARAVTPDRVAMRQSYAAADEFGVPLTRGQASGNVRMRQNEDTMMQGASTEEAQRIMGSFADRQAAAIAEGGMRIPARGQAPLTHDLNEAGTLFADSMRGRRDALRETARENYERAFALARGEQVAPSDELLPRIESVLDEEFIEAGPARAIIARLQAAIQRGDATFATIERARQALNRLQRTAQQSRNAADEYAIDLVVSELDGWTAGLMGAPGARRAMEQARGIFAELRNLYGRRTRTDLSTGHVGRSDPGGAAIERVIDTDLTGQQIADAILGQGNRPPAAALGAVRRVREIAENSIVYTNRNAASGVRVPGRGRVGGRTRGARRMNPTQADVARHGVELPTDEVQALREAVFHRVLAPLTARNDGGMVPAQTIVTNLRQALDGPGAQIMRELYTDGEMAAMRRFLGVVERITRPVGVNTSGTLAALSRAAQQAFDGLIAVLFGGANIATLGVAGAVRQANRQLDATIQANAATTRPGINIQLPRAFGAAPPLAPAIAAEERLRETEMRGTAPDELPPETQRQDAMIDEGQVTQAAPGTVTFPAGDGSWITLEIGDMSPPRALQAWAEGRLAPLGVFATEAEAQAAATTIDRSRPILENRDGSFSTEETITIEADGRYFIIPTIINGGRVGEDEAVMAWRRGANPEVASAGSADEAEALAQARSSRLGRERQRDRRTPAFAQ